ncbi:MAG: hypothetical protein DYG89_07355 [Caldilinea sp. CFX5]|nr:hypothetical protein [Caldilinea sp. CFX5]
MNSNCFYHRLSQPWLTAIFLLVFSIASLLAATHPVQAQDESNAAIWSDLPDGVFAARAEQQIAPQKYRALLLNPAALQAQLATAPGEGSTAVRSAGSVLTLPLPDGGWGRFQIVESPIMAPELAAQFPEIKTYAGQGLDDPTATLRLDWTPAGFHAIILSAGETVYIDPLFRDNITNYASYFKRDFGPTAKQFTESEPLDPTGAWASQLAAMRSSNLALAASGTQLRTYRLALAATGEYTQFHGGTVAKALAAITTSINRVNAVYEREVAVRMVLIANNNLIIYTDAGTDPYSNNDGGAMLGQNISNLNSVIGAANYDIGHVFSTGGGGVAYLGVVCNNSWKGGGVTGSWSPVGDPFDIDYVAHEIGHQFGADHTFNSNTGACSGNRSASVAYEPGSGSTIMAYAGICGAQDLQTNSDDYFHGISFDQIVAYTTLSTGNNCAVKTNTGNTPPTANAGASYTIPKQTPFTLTGSGSDANGDSLTYNWEEFDLGAAGAPNNDTNPPFFRSFKATASPVRTFPKWSDILNNTTSTGEILPNATRTLNFRLTVRDNRSGGGGVNFASTTVNVTTAAGPFRVTAPNTALSWAAGETRTVTWDVAGTTAAPVSCPNVKILLSTNGGSSYPITLLAGTPNDGSADVTVPNNPTTTARIQVICANNIFFDISNVNFTIIGSTPATITIAFDSQPDNTRNVGYTTSNLGSFKLDDPTTDDGDTIAKSKSFSVAPGTYIITETATANWFLNSIVCNPAGNSSVNLAARRVAITVAAGANVTCTFTDQRAGNITAIKFNDLNGNGLRASTEPYLNGWTIRLYSSPTALVATRVTADFISGGSSYPGRARFLNIAPGVYTLCEDQQTGWINTRPGATNASYGNRPCVAVTVAPGTSYTVLFGNRQGVSVAASPTERSSIVASTLLGETDEEGNELNPAPEQEIIEEEESAVPKVFLPLAVK